MIGIYKITNNINGKVYIGQSWDIEKRWKQHKSILQHDKKYWHNMHLYSAFFKYGIECFRFEILIKLNNGPFTQKHLDYLESVYIKVFDSINQQKGYNKKDGGSNGKMSVETKKKISDKNKGKQNFLGKKHSEETRKKLSESKKGSKNPNYGKHPSEEIKQKMSIKMKGNNNPWYGKHHSKEARQKMSEAKKRMVICIETGEIFYSVKEAEIKTSIRHISPVALGKQKTAGGFHWEYL